MQQADTGDAGLLLLFPLGMRPTVDDLAQLLNTVEAGVPARVSHRPAPETGCLELLVSGLTFDVRGLSPAVPVNHDAKCQVYGFDGAGPENALEAVQIMPSGHISAGHRLPPVTRAMISLAANLALHLPVAGLVWQPAGTLMEPRYFSRIVFNWLSGGAFPALGLTALVPAADGSVVSNGLAHFIGQEMQLEGRAKEARADTVKLAIRVVDYLATHGPLTEAHTIASEQGNLLAEPSTAGRRIWVWRDAN